MGEPSRDEIDLLDIAIRLIQSLKKHFILLTTAALLGAGLGYGASAFVAEVYNSQMIIVSEVLSKSFGERMTVSINALIDQRNTKGLSEGLTLNETDASLLRHLDVSCVVEIDTRQRRRDLVERKEKTFFTIKADVSDPRLLPKLQAGLIDYLLHDRLAEASILEIVQLYKPLIDKVDEELRDLETIKQRILEGKTISPSSQDITMIDPATLFSEIVHLTERRLEYQGYLDNSKVVQLVEEFTIPDKPSSPERSNYILIGFLVGGVVGFGFVVLRKLVRLASANKPATS